MAKHTYSLRHWSKLMRQRVKMHIAKRHRAAKLESMMRSRSLIKCVGCKKLVKRSDSGAVADEKKKCYGRMCEACLDARGLQRHSQKVKRRIDWRSIQNMFGFALKGKDGEKKPEKKRRPTSMQTRAAFTKEIRQALRRPRGNR